jgi:hypothetical protein
MWECPKCHEKVEDSFDVCWNCGTSADGTEDPAFRRADEDSPPAEGEALALQHALPAEGEALPAEQAEQAPPRPSACPRCQSPDLIPHVRVVDRSWRMSFSATVEYDLGLQAEVDEDPDALAFKGTHTGTLTASICGRCGYAELYVSNPAELLAAYRRSQGP